MSDDMLAAIKANTEALAANTQARQEESDQVRRLADAIEGMTIILAADLTAEDDGQEAEPAAPSLYMDGSAVG